MQKLAVYGGTFNPIHVGHLHLAEQFQKRLLLDQVLLVPVNVPPHKEAPDLASAEDRLEMCRLAAQGSGFEVSDLEFRRRGPSYTVDTLKYLKERFPDTKLFLITGEDMFLTLLSWRRAEEIFQMAEICAAPRSWEGLPRMEKYAEKLMTAGARVSIQDIQYLPVSSTMVRQAIRDGKSIRGLVPDAVAEYITSKHLYEESLLWN